MRKTMLALAWLAPITVIIAVSAFALFGAAAKAPLEGTPAPDFTLDSQEGASVSLHDFRGKWVVLYFYPKDFTSGCTVEAHNFQRDLAEFEKRNAVILGVSVQDEKSHESFCAKEGLHFKLLADTKKQVSETYGSIMNLLVTKLSARHTFLIDPQGIIRKVWLNVDVHTHSRDVLAALDQLQSSSPH